MAEKTQKELLVSLIEMQGKQNSDITEIKTCLLGDEYHPEGLVNQVQKNKNCINKIKKIQSKREGIFMTMAIIFAAGITAFFNLVFNNK